MNGENALAVEVSKDGLSVLVNPDRPILDIVFVHGFTGHPERTWTYKGGVRDDQAVHNEETCEPPSKRPKLFSSNLSYSKKTVNRKTVYWPRDILPITVPNARVLTYGYDTRIRHRLGGPASNSTIYDIAWDLIVSLEAERRCEPSRRLLFVAHSLGGIVVKEALRRSYGCERRHSDLHSIYESTSGVFFFGTPHGGTDPEGLIFSIVTNVMKILGLSVNEQIVNALLPSSERLRELRDEFGPMARQKKWIIYSFQEQHGISALNGRKVVDDTASCLNDLDLEIRQHIVSDHMDMCRFSGLNDGEYKKVAGALDRIQRGPRNVTPTAVRSALSANDRRIYLDALKFNQIDARHATIKMAHAKTCKWLLTRSEYQDWLDDEKLSEHHGFLWIKGKPGTGKSTIMKFAYTRAKKSFPGTVISFFFNARGERLERSTLGMYRSLTYQLLEKLTDLQGILGAYGLTAPSGHDIHEPDVEMVKVLFQSAIESLGQRYLTCFIDALDECEEDEVREMVAFFEHLGELAVSSQSQLRVCFSSRHYPHVTIEKGIQLVLEDQEGHDEDMARYLESELKAGSGTRVQKIKDEIRQRARGIFLWVVLVISILNKEYSHGRIHALRKRLDEIPDDLDELFQDILTRDRQNMDELRLCLQWMLFARRPLKPEELYFAILAGVDPEAATEWNPEEISKDDMKRFILSSSKGLAETTRSTDSTVQFIHESVRDFLLKENGPNRLQFYLGENFRGFSHEQLKQCCQSYMTVDSCEYLPQVTPSQRACAEADAEFRPLSEKYPFLEYAARNILYHADTADQYGISQDLWLEKFPLEKWITLDNLFEKFRIRRYTSNASLLYILAERGLSRLLRIELKRVKHMDIEGERYGFPLLAALANSNESAVQALLTPDTSACSEGNTPATEGEYEEALGYLLQIGCDIDFKKGGSLPGFKKGRSLLSWAAEHNGILAKVMLATRKVDANHKEKDGQTPLWWAARNGHEAVVKLLVERDDVEADPKDTQYGQTPLSWAAENGHEAVVKLLVERDDVEADPKDTQYGQTPLSWAARNGHEAVVKLLVERDDVEADSKDTLYGRTPLSWAAENGREAVVKLLVERDDVEADPKDTLHSQTPLSWAAENGHEAVVKLLVKRDDVKADSKDQNGRTPLSWAAGNGHQAVFKLLQRRKAP